MLDANGGVLEVLAERGVGEREVVRRAETLKYRQSRVPAPDGIGGFDRPFRHTYAWIRIKLRTSIKGNRTGVRVEIPRWIVSYARTHERTNGSPFGQPGHCGAWSGSGLVRTGLRRGRFRVTG